MYLGSYKKLANVFCLGGHTSSIHMGSGFKNPNCCGFHIVNNQVQTFYDHFNFLYWLINLRIEFNSRSMFMFLRKMWMQFSHSVQKEAIYLTDWHVSGGFRCGLALSHLLTQSSSKHKSQHTITNIELLIVKRYRLNLLPILWWLEYHYTLR